MVVDPYPEPNIYCQKDNNGYRAITTA